MMLQRLIADAREMEAESSAAESEAQRDYETFGKDHGHPWPHGLDMAWLDPWTMQLLSRSAAIVKLGVICPIWTCYRTTTGIYWWLRRLDAGYGWIQQSNKWLEAWTLATTDTIGVTNGILP